jgi:hypothetical protein
VNKRKRREGAIKKGKEGEGGVEGMRLRSETDLVLCVLEVEDKTTVLVLVLWVYVLMQVEQLLLHIVSNGLHISLLQTLHVQGVLTPKCKVTII